MIIQKFLIHSSIEVTLQLGDSHSWFKHMVMTWIQLTIELRQNFIKKALELKEIGTNEEGKGIYVSATDLRSFLIEVGKFWKNINWPDASVSYGLMVYVVEQICECVLYYVKELYQCQTSKFDKEGKFLASQEVSCNSYYIIIVYTLWLPLMY